mmetsp:Transcript_40993/g.124208  ORF Transcript_40993/g.124208 Transcript_40993/m.124208 type:complete len:175 (-) Transcript_40993:7-531(-)
MDDSICINFLFGNEPEAWYSGQWCYVSDGCAEASPANRTASVRIKTCQPGRDAMLREKTPVELHEWARKHGLEFGLTVKTAYPVEQQLTWPAASAAFGQDPGAAARPLDAAQAAKLRAIRNSGRPVVLDSEDEHPPYAVVWGSAAYLLEPAREQPQPGRPFTYTSWSCVHGCGP